MIVSLCLCVYRQSFLNALENWQLKLPNHIFTATDFCDHCIPISIDWRRKDTAKGMSKYVYAKNFVSFVSCHEVHHGENPSDQHGFDRSVRLPFENERHRFSMRLFIFIACREKKKASALAQTISINKCVRTWGRKRTNTPERIVHACFGICVSEWVYVFGHMQVPLIKFRAPFFSHSLRPNRNNTYIFYMLYFYYCD